MFIYLIDGKMTINLYSISRFYQKSTTRTNHVNCLVFNDGKEIDISENDKIKLDEYLLKNNLLFDRKD